MATKTSRNSPRTAPVAKAPANFDYLNSGSDGYYASLARTSRTK
jgi:hypothetical protein